MLVCYRQNQELEQNSIALQEQHLRLQQQAEGLAKRLEVVLHDKFGHRHSGFDSDTPIDKTLNFLEGIVEVSPLHNLRCKLSSLRAA